MERPDWAPVGVDLDRPNAARVYDFYLGGSHNFAVDRAMARQALELWPELPELMQANRAFLRRAVCHLVDEGVRQFLDIGSGIPTVGNVHEVARRADPAARVVYVDIDPVAVAHTRALLADDPLATVVHGDLRDPGQILAAPELQGLLDLDKPIAILMVAVLHFVADDDDPWKLVARLRDAAAPGSFLALSHASHEGQPELASSHQALYARSGNRMTMRSRADIERFFDGFDLVEPGLVYLPLWRPEPFALVDDNPERFTGFAGMGRKRA